MVQPARTRPSVTAPAVRSTERARPANVGRPAASQIARPTPTLTTGGYRGTPPTEVGYDGYRRYFDAPLMDRRYPLTEHEVRGGG